MRIGSYLIALGPSHASTVHAPPCHCMVLAWDTYSVMWLSSSYKPTVSPSPVPSTHPSPSVKSFPVS